MIKHQLKALLCLLAILTLLPVSSIAVEMRFTPEIANTLGLSNWLGSGRNRALLAFSLGAEAASNGNLGRTDVLQAFVYGTSFVGKDKNDGSLVVGTVTDSSTNNLVFIKYSQKRKEAIITTYTESGEKDMVEVKLEIVFIELCSEYYKVEREDMQNAIAYLDSILN